MSTNPNNQQNVRGWQHGRHPRTTRKRGSKWKRVFWSVLGSAAIISAIIALFVYLRSTPETYFLTIPISQYKHRAWPTNPYADKDSTLLRDQFPGETSDAFESQTLASILQELSNPHTKSKRQIVLHVCALAVVRDDQVYLLPADAMPDSRPSWLALQDVIELVARHPAKHKLLILDLREVPPSPDLGILENDVGTALESVLKSQDSKFLVLSAYSAAERSLLFYEGASSIFAYYLAKGLSGRADGYQSTNNTFTSVQEHSTNGRVTVQELAAYVGYHVDRWARSNRHTRQRPFLFGKGDFTIGKVNPDEWSEPKPEHKYPDWLEEGWKLRDTWRKDGTLVAAAKPFVDFQRLLKRSEERWLGGLDDDEDKLKTELAWDSERIQHQVTKAQKPPRSLPFSLAAIFSPNASGDAETSENDKNQQAIEAFRSELESLFEQMEIAPPPQKDLKAKQKELAKQAKELPYLARLQTIWTVLQKPRKTSQAHIKMALELIQDRPSDWKQSERIASEKLKTLIEDFEFFKTTYMAEWDGGSVKQYLDTTEKAETTWSQLESSPRAIPWVVSALHKADILRRKGEKALARRNSKDWSQARKALADAEEKYTTVQKRIRDVQDATTKYTKALTTLPGYVEYFLTAPIPKLPEEPKWFDAIETVITLHRILNDPDPSNFFALEDAIGKLDSSEDAFKSSMRRQLDGLRENRNPGPKDYRLMKAILTRPDLSHSVRIDLWNRARDLSWKRHQQFVESDDGEFNSRIDAPEPTTKELKQARLNRRERIVKYNLELLKLAGRDTTKAVEAYDRNSWKRLAIQLREHWTKELFDDFVRSEQKPFQAQRLGCFVSAFHHDEVPDKDHWAHNPTYSLDQKYRLLFRTHLKKRYEEDLKAIQAMSALYRRYIPFYKRAIIEITRND
ncbi:MAG: hypothetical protein ACFCD0_22335 [Gemmataceae bacterium]